MKRISSYINIGRLILLICLLVVQWEILPAQASLNTYLEQGAKYNPGLKSRFNQYMASLELIPQVGALPDPKVVFGVFISPVETRVGAQRGNLSVSQMFPWFGTLDARESVAAEAAKSRYESFQEAKIRLFYDLKQTYYDLYELQASERITRENLELLNSFEALARIKFEAGKASFADILRVQLEINELENQLAYFVDTEAPVVARFEQLLNQPTGDSLLVPDTLWSASPPDKTVIRETILAQSPSLKRLDHQSLMWENQVTVAQKLGKPSFSVGINYINVARRSSVEITGNGRDALLLPQVGINIPLYRKKYDAMVKEAQIRKQAVADEKEDLSNRLETDLEKAWRDYQDALRRVDLYRRQRRIAQQALDILVAEYSVSGTEFEDVLKIDRQILDYSFALEKARADQNTAVAYLNYLMGI